MVHSRKPQKITEGPTNSGYLNDLRKVFFFGKLLRLRGSSLQEVQTIGHTPVRGTLHHRGTEKTNFIPRGLMRIKPDLAWARPRPCLFPCHPHCHRRPLCHPEGRALWRTEGSMELSTVSPVEAECGERDSWAEVDLAVHVGRPGEV